MHYWLMKSEPNVWSIDQQKKTGLKGAPWDGVRNHQAAKNLKSMKKGDQCFFYHSNIGKEIVGIVKVLKEAFIDITDKKKRFVAVQVRFVKKFNSSVSLENIKKNNSSIIVTTEKDYQRLDNAQKQSCNFIEVDLEIENKEYLSKIIQTYL